MYFSLCIQVSENLLLYLPNLLFPTNMHWELSCHFTVLAIQIHLRFVWALDSTLLLHPKSQDYEELSFSSASSAKDDSLSTTKSLFCISIISSGILYISYFDQLFDYLVFYFLPPSIKVLRLISIIHTIQKDII